MVTPVMIKSTVHRFVPVAIWLLVFASYLRAMAPGLTQWDSAELALAALNLDLTHPPGYGLQCLINRLILCVPLGGPFFRLGVASAAFGAAAAALLYSAARAAGWRVLASLTPAVLLATAPFMWTQCTLVEKFSLHVFLAAILLRQAFGPNPTPVPMALVLGLCLAHHQLGLLLLPAAAIAVWRRGRTRAAPRKMIRVALLSGVLLLLPVSVRILYPPIRSTACRISAPGNDRMINWGEPASLRAFMRYATAEEFSGRFFESPWSRRSTLFSHLGVWRSELGLIGLGLAVLGAIALVRRRDASALGVAGVIGLSWYLNLGLLIPPDLMSVYHQNDLLMAVFLGGAGMEAVCRLAIGTARMLPPALLILHLGYSVFGAPFTRDMSRHLMVHDAYAAVIAGAPHDSLILGVHGLDLFAVRSFQSLLGRGESLRSIQLGGSDASSVRRDYASWMNSVTSPAMTSVSNSDPARIVLLKVLMGAGSARCVVITAVSFPFAMPEHFVRSGALFIGRTSGCAEWRLERATTRFLWPMSFRSWFAEASRTPVNDSFKHMLIVAGAFTDK